MEEANLPSFLQNIEAESCDLHRELQKAAKGIVICTKLANHYAVLLKVTIVTYSQGKELLIKKEGG
mgnify:FL=1